MKKEKQKREISLNEGEVDFKEVFPALKRYYKSILIISLLATLLAFVYVYFATSIYQSDTLISITEKKQAGDLDLITIAKSSSLEHEMAVFRSRQLAGKTLENLNIGIRYFTKENLKHYELYKNSPFIVTFEYLSERAMELPIQLIPDKEGHFRLVIEPTLKEKVINGVRSFIAPLPADEQPIVYDKLHSFGEKIETLWFTITVQQVYKLENDKYSFTMLPNELMTTFIGENLLVSSYSGDAIIASLTFQDNVSLRAKEILDALTSAYIRENMEINSKSANKKLHFIDMQLEAINKTLKGSSEKLERYKATNIVVDIGSKAQLTAEKLSELETQLYEINMNIDIRKSILNYIETHKDIKGINISSTQSVDVDGGALQTIILDIQKTIALHSDMSSEFKATHPNVIKINRQLVSLQNQLKVAIQGSLRILQKYKQSLGKVIKENKVRMQAFPEQEKRLARLTRNFMVNEKIYSFLLEKRAETAIVESSTVSETRILESAAVADLPIKPEPTFIITLAFLFGLIIAIAQAIFRAYLDNTIKSVEDIEKLTTIPIYGSIPLLRSKKNLQPYYEALRVTRTNLEFSQNTGKSKLITVTSFVSGEGKTTTITELGKIIAKGNKKVIILDMDMRRPTVHEKFNFSNKIGMSTLLAGKNSLEEVIQETGDANLNVITSGIIPPNPSELMMSDKLTEVSKELMSQYDYVLLDSPPIGMVTDAMIIMRLSNLNLFVLKANNSKKEFINNINRVVDDHDLNAGIILNGITFDKTLGYGYDYGYGYGYGTKDDNKYLDVNN